MANINQIKYEGVLFDIEDANVATAGRTGSYNDLTNKLTAGENITIDANNVISATGGGGAGNPDNESIILNEDDELAVSYGGSWSVGYGPEHWGDETLGADGPDNLAPITTTGEFIRADYDGTGISYDDDKYNLLMASLNTNTLWCWENHGFDADDNEVANIQIHAKPYKVEENATISGETCDYVIYMRPDEDPFDPDSGAEYINECAFAFVRHDEDEFMEVRVFANFTDNIEDVDMTQAGWFFCKVYPNREQVYATPIKPHVIPCPNNGHLYVDDDVIDVDFGGNAQWANYPQMVNDQEEQRDWWDDHITEETYGDFALLDTEGMTIEAEFPFAKGGTLAFRFAKTDSWEYRFVLSSDGESKAKLRESSWFERPGYRYLKVDKDWQPGLELEEDLLLVIVLDDDHPNTVCGIDFTGAEAGIYVRNDEDYQFRHIEIPSYREKLVHRHLDSKQFPTTLAKVPMAPNSAGTYTLQAVVSADGAEPTYSWVSAT